MIDVVVRRGDCSFVGACTRCRLVVVYNFDLWNRVFWDLKSLVVEGVRRWTTILCGMVLFVDYGHEDYSRFVVHGLRVVYSTLLLLKTTE